MYDIVKTQILPHIFPSDYTNFKVSVIDNCAFHSSGSCVHVGFCEHCNERKGFMKDR